MLTKNPQELSAIICLLLAELESELWQDQNLNKNSGRQGIDFNSIDDTKFDNPNFIEAYKMSVSPKYNKNQINQLLLNYLGSCPVD